ncbi:hypothetical protein CTI12_AA110610 [Artemisia annua]|uniref:Uncharacterized protein n=1 Tax=Artemisia annua TaxID=35608 RepID=A0A2U1PVD1_ARTAN|nr:hypothetical protein CTI12_AA110610 [Artemisia annua]
METVGGAPDDCDFPQISGIDITPWVKEICAKFECLKALHIRGLVVSNEHLALLAKTRGEWLRELALRNTPIESLYLSFVNYDVEILTLVAQKCSNSLVSLKVSPKPLNHLGDAFSHAVKLQDFHGTVFYEDGAILVSSFPQAFCFLIERCPNLEVLITDDVCGDMGLQVIGRVCKKLRKLIHYGYVTHMGLIGLVQGCINLEYLDVTLSNISNEAIECVGTHLKNLRVFRITMFKFRKASIDNGIRAMLKGCIKLKRLSLGLGDEEGLTDVGLGTSGVVERVPKIKKANFM